MIASKAEQEQKQEKARDAVADLERRLAMIGNSTSNTSEAAVTPAEVPAFAQAPPSSDSSAKTGKNALLARIMAAQERAKQAQQVATTAPPPPAAAAAPPIDLLSGETAPAAPPAFDESLLPPPSSFDTNTQQQQAPPPAFDDTFLPPPPAAAAAPPTWNAVAPPAPSAPDFDLLAEYDAKPPPMQEALPAPVPPGGIDESAIAAIMGMEGLSEAEKKALVEEQIKILASIQGNKVENNQAAAAHNAANAFEQRSFSAAVGANVHVGKNHDAVVQGPGATHQSMQDGTALLVQCQSCQNWMNVTGQATLMLCPVCSTVSAIRDESMAMTAEEAAQLDADAKLAAELQKEEYSAADRAEERQKRRQEEARKKAAAASSSSSSSWMEWLGLSSGSSSGGVERPTNFEQGVLVRGQVGVSRPPGAGSASPSSAIRPGSSYDEEDAALLRGSGGARVAQSQPLFSCVADSITSAASQLQVALHGDGEGNVHGVDSSGLLAMPKVGRERGSSSDQPYEPLNRS